MTFPYKGVSGAAARAFSIWVKSTEAEPGAALFVTGKGADEFSLQIAEDGSGAAQVVAGAVTLTGSTSLLDGMWHQVMVSLGNGGTVGDIGLYVDGADETPDVGAQTSTVIDTKGNDISLGARGNKDYFKGIHR